MPEELRLLFLDGLDSDAKRIEAELRDGGVLCALHRVESVGALAGALESIDPHLVLSDYEASCSSAELALRLVREKRPDTPFLVVAGAIGEERTAELLAEGAAAYVSKEQLSKLPQAVQRALTNAVAARVAREEVRRHTTLLHSIPEAIVGLDEEERITFSNPAAEELLGLSATEAMAASLHAVLNFHGNGHGNGKGNGGNGHGNGDGAQPDHGYCPVAVAMRERTVRREIGVLRFRERNGTGRMIAADYSCAPLNPTSGLSGCVLAFRDISERSQLRKSDDDTRRLKAVGRVASTLAHEFNNILMGIQPFTELITRQIDDHAVILDSVSHIRKSVERGKRVIDEILRFTRAAEPVAARVDLVHWLREMSATLRPILGRGISISFTSDAEKALVSADRLQLQRVLVNICVNASEAMPDGGTISIELHTRSGGWETFALAVPHRERYLVCTVRDTGRGMSEEVARDIFDPYFTTKRLGTGLGLAVAHQVMRQHGGWIFVESIPGEGSAFHLLLPRFEEMTSHC